MFVKRYIATYKQEKARKSRELEIIPTYLKLNVNLPVIIYLQLSLNPEAFALGFQESRR